MVFCLPPHLDDAQASAGIARSLGEHSKEVGWADVVGAGTSHKQTAGPEHFESAKVQLLITTHGGIELALRLGECGRVNHDGVVAASRAGIVAEKVESIGFDPLNVALIQGCVLVGDFERWTGAIDPRDG
jgi:hypothetical protein